MAMAIAWRRLFTLRRPPLLSSPSLYSRITLLTLRRCFGLAIEQLPVSASMARNDPSRAAFPRNAPCDCVLHRKARGLAQTTAPHQLPWALNAVSVAELDLVALDDGVGEELLAHLLDSGAGARRVGLGKIEIDHFALAHLVYAGKAERCQGMPDRLALGIEHAVLQHDMDARFHCTVCGPLMSVGPPSCCCRRQRRGLRVAHDKAVSFIEKVTGIALLAVDAEGEEGVAAFADESAVSRIHVEHAAGDGRTRAVERAALGRHAVDADIGLGGVDVPQDGTVLGGIAAQMTIDRAGEDDPRDRGRRRRLCAAATPCAPAAHRHGGGRAPDALAVRDAERAEATRLRPKEIGDRDIDVLFIGRRSPFDTAERATLAKAGLP